MNARSVLSRFVRVEPGEGRGLLWAAASFFFLLSGYYIIRPLREEMGTSAGGGFALNWLFLATLAGTFLVTPVFGALVSKFPRRVFVPAVYHALAASFVAFYVALSVLSGPQRLATARFFFVFVSTFNLLIVSVFWGFLADLFRSEQAKRLFGAIGLGGTLGGITGGAITAGLAKTLGPVPLLLVAAGLFEIAVFCMSRLARVYGVDKAGAPGERAGAPAGVPPGTGALSGVSLFAKSRYLLGIAGFLLLYTVGSTFLYLSQARIARAAFHDAGARTAFFARIDLTVNVLTALMQLFLTGRLLPALGLGPALALLPLVTAGGFVALGASPAAGTLFFVQVFRRAAEFALVKPAREALFTVVSREEKYSAKSFIDTFVYRSGDALGALADRLVALLGLGPAGFAWAFLPVAALWTWNALTLGSRQRALARLSDAPAGAVPAV
ncbi:MAG TPA: MFS transporter [Thermoanaerobaculia bacterium]|nr:MFS transporter [Thermoanaerobaculia bacterium]